jgi:hypothetical protein
MWCLVFGHLPKPCSDEAVSRLLVAALGLLFEGQKFLEIFLAIG